MLLIHSIERSPGHVCSRTYTALLSVSHNSSRQTSAVPTLPLELCCRPLGFPQQSPGEREGGEGGLQEIGLINFYPSSLLTCHKPSLAPSPPSLTAIPPSLSLIHPARRPGQPTISPIYPFLPLLEDGSRTRTSQSTIHKQVDTSSSNTVTNDPQPRRGGGGGGRHEGCVYPHLFSATRFLRHVGFATWLCPNSYQDGPG